MSLKSQTPVVPVAGTLAQLNALALGAGDVGAVAWCTDWAGGARLVQWDGTRWQAQSNHATAMKIVDAICDDSNFTNATAPSGAVTPIVGSLLDGGMVALVCTVNNTKWGGFWLYNQSGTWTRARGFEEGAIIPDPTLFVVSQPPLDGKIYALRFSTAANQNYHQAQLGVAGWSYYEFMALGSGGGGGLTHGQIMARVSLGF